MNQENNQKVDLSGALKDSGAGVKFQDQKTEPIFFPGTPKVVQWTIKYSGGLVKNARQANYVLIGFFAIAILLTAILVARSLSGPPVPPLGSPQTPTPQSSGEFGEPSGAPF